MQVSPWDMLPSEPDKPPAVILIALGIVFMPTRQGNASDGIVFKYQARTMNGPKLRQNDL